MNLVKKRGLEEQIVADSCGTGGWHIGEKPDHRSIEVANQHHISVDHRARQFHKTDYGMFQYILAMDSSNYKNIVSMAGGKRHDNLFLMLDFDDDKSGKEVPDPYYGGDEGFQKVYDMLEESCNNLLDHIVDKELVN